MELFAHFAPLMIGYDDTLAILPGLPSLLFADIRPF